MILDTEYGTAIAELIRSFSQGYVYKFSIITPEQIYQKPDYIVFKGQSVADSLRLWASWQSLEGAKRYQEHLQEFKTQACKEIFESTFRNG